MDKDETRRLPTYDEPTKVAARLQALGHAVDLLTTRREQATIVPADYVGRVKEALLASNRPEYADAAAQCIEKDIESWKTFRSNTLGSRRPDALTAAYLAGPLPSNDLKAMIALGLRPENIWAFEIGAEEIASGLEDLESLGLRGVKFIPVKLEKYLAGTSRRFDIIYVDACGSLPSHEKRTTSLIVDIFRCSALAPLGVLITNFSKPDVSNPQVFDDFAAVAAAYLYPKDFVEGADGGADHGPSAYGLLVDSPCDAGESSDDDDEADESFLELIKENFDRFYGAFLTRHVVDIASIVAPTLRLVTSGLFGLLFDKDIKKATDRGRRFTRFETTVSEADASGEEVEAVGSDAADDFVEMFDMGGEAVMEPGRFSLLWTLAACGSYADVAPDLAAFPRLQTKCATRWIRQLGGSSGLSSHDTLAAYYAWRHDGALWSEHLRRLGEFPFEQMMPFFCDRPTDELAFYPAFAQLACPAHANISQIRRFSYVAEGRSTRMFLDVIPFDECRYVYDWLSGTSLTGSDWTDPSAQLTFRFALDAVAHNLRWFGDDFLSACHVIGDPTAFPDADMAQRIDLSPDGRSAG